MGGKSLLAPLNHHLKKVLIMFLIWWNIRGLIARAKRSSLRKIITQHDPIFVFIQETKMNEMNKKTVRTYWKADEIEWIFSPADGNSEEIIFLWNKNSFTMKSSSIAKHWIAISGCIPTINFECTLIDQCIQSM